jgi:hypothetical protein
MKMLKKFSAGVAVVLLLGIFSCEDTTSPTSSYTVTISGTVTRVNNSLLDSVIVILKNPFKTDTTGTDGTFNITFTTKESNTTTTQLTFYRLGFYSDTVEVQYSPTLKEVSVGQVALKGLTSAQDSVVTGRPSARAGNIIFVGSGVPSLSIAGAGGIDFTNLAFEVRDSLGNPVDEKNATTVRFRLRNDASLGVQLNKDSAKTLSNGQVIVQLKSGTKAGLAQVQAYLKSDTTIKSSVVTIPIHGGLPDSTHFTIGVEKVNLPGGVKFGERSSVKVLVGDKFGNPVKEGTPVLFTTTGGIIQPSSTTSKDGDVSVDLITGNPVPANGIATVTAEIPSSELAAGLSLNKKSTSILLKKYSKVKSTEVLSTSSAASTFTRSVDVIFSGASRIGFTDNNFVVPVQGEKTLSFTVSDPLGHPLAATTNIRVVGLGLDSLGVLLSGDLDKTLPDTKDASYTQFSFTISDRRTTSLNQSRQLSLSIEVNSPNGNIKQNVTGYLGFAPVDTTGVPNTSRKPAQIAFISTSTNDIYVSGVGGVETATLTYEVRDSLGVPIDSKGKVGVSYSLQFVPNSFTSGGTSPSIIPTFDSTDNQGRMRVTVVSGTQAGVVQIISNVQLSQSKIISSQPVKVSVHAGFPDQNHFTIAAPYYNFPGLDRAFERLNINVGVTDKYSNPVIAGTAVYFNTSHGTVTTTGTTNAEGLVTNTLLSANPYPETGKTLAGLEPGYTRVYARTVGQNGVQVLDSILVLWTGQPIFTNTGASTFTVSNGGISSALTFTIQDRYNHPMSNGTTITVETTEGEVVGQKDIKMPDTFSSGNGLTSFTVQIKDANTTDTDPAKEASVYVNVNHPVYGSYKFLLASGTVD